jgi:hypothetical protein
MRLLRPQKTRAGTDQPEPGSLQAAIAAAVKGKPVIHDRPYLPTERMNLLSPESYGCRGPADPSNCNTVKMSLLEAAPFRLSMNSGSHDCPSCLN